MDLAMNNNRKNRRKACMHRLVRKDPLLLWTLIAFFTIEMCFFSPIGDLLLKHEPQYLAGKNNEPLVFHKFRYSWIGRRLNSATALDYSTYPDAPKLVIATLVTNHQSDIDKLCRAFESLGFLKGDVKGFPTPILVFNDGSLSNFQLEKIVESTDRPIAFPLVNDLDTFPDDFDPSSVVPTTKNTNFNSNSYWFYPQMTQFWIYTVWKHPAIDAFDFIMRMDSDTCFYEENNHLPDFAKLHNVYHAQYVGVEPDANKVQGLHDFVNNYMAEEDILPTNPLQWQLVTNVWSNKKTLPLYQVSLEVVRKSFMQHEDVMKFHKAVITRKPYGVFQYGWSDHVLRFIDTALFVSNENFMTTGFQGFHNRVSCAAAADNKDLNKGIEKGGSEVREEQKLEEIIIKNKNVSENLISNKNATEEDVQVQLIIEKTDNLKQEEVKQINKAEEDVQVQLIIEKTDNLKQEVKQINKAEENVQVQLIIEKTDNLKQEEVKQINKAEEDVQVQLIIEKTDNLKQEEVVYRFT